MSFSDGTSAELCRQHADEMARSLQVLQQMQGSVTELRERMSQAHGGLQESGESLLKLLDMLQEALRVQSAIVESRKVRKLNMFFDCL